MKIILNEFFEMKNFLPKLNEREFWQILSEEEKEVFFDLDSHQIILIILKDVLRKYFSGKRKKRIVKVRERK